ncbi:gamma-glutamyl-gamma-aminobutyrate hydrolase family protein [Nisaea nitritireducens]|uniref:gamma-glutamyl-gamma-aminobutyrate hydrolase family protein n=1 Tax=Nisaea nitritireducens TaxID=568392 RepID=UPI001869341B|nr:gamma-glutamyl-gamma-aminobutyrate hydrolase family protein [Nisaea nitritireducens]
MSNSYRPLIGISTSSKSGLIPLSFHRFAIWRAGGRSVRLGPDRPLDADALDGVIIGGGSDLAPALYSGEVTIEEAIDPERDAFELALLDQFRDGKRPVLGICRGAQILNVYFGGDLHNEISEAYPGTRARRTPLPVKRIEIDEGSRLREMLGVSWCRVNSIHHQSVDRIGEGLRVSAHDRRGMVQGIESTGDQLFFGVQWHPEFLVFNRPQQRLYRALIRAAAGKE